VVAKLLDSSLKYAWKGLRRRLAKGLRRGLRRDLDGA